MASAFLSERFPAVATLPFQSLQASPTANRLSFPSLSVLFSYPIEPVSLASHIISGMSAHVPPVIPGSTIAMSRPVCSVLAILIGILSHAPPALGAHISFPVSYSASTLAIANYVPVLPIVFTSTPVISASVSVSPAPTAANQPSSEPVIVIYHSSAPEPVTANDSPRAPVVALLRERWCKIC